MNPRINHRRKNLAEYALLVFLFSVLLLLPGCDFAREQVANIKMPRGTDLNFETIMFEYDQDLDSDRARIEVFADNQVQMTGKDRWITDEVRSKILAVDFSRYFVLVAMMGDMGSMSYEIHVNRIWQNENVVYVKAKFVFPESGSLQFPATTSPKHIVKVSKEKMTDFGKITFKLWDKFGREWATASQEVPQ
jgi:hypothetical protein